MIKSDSKNQHFIVTKSINEQFTLNNVQIKNLNKLLDTVFIFFLIIFSENIFHIYNRTSSKWLRFLMLVAFRSKLILHERGNLWNANSNQIRLSIKNCQAADIIICNSNATSKYIQKRCNINSQKIRVVHNGININQSICRKSSLNTNLGIIKIAFIGRIEAHKGLISLLKAVQNLPADSYILNIVGDGVLRQQYESNYGQNENINFLGIRANIHEFLSQEVDILVVPSIREPLGNVCIEAGLAGVAVIAANVDGLPEIVEDGITGLLIDPKLEITERFAYAKGGIIPQFVIEPACGELVKPKALDPADIASAIEKIRKNRSLRETLGENLKKRVIKEFSIERYNSKILKIYESI